MIDKIELIASVSPMTNTNLRKSFRRRQMNSGSRRRTIETNINLDESGSGTSEKGKNEGVKVPQSVKRLSLM